MKDNHHTFYLQMIKEDKDEEPTLHIVSPTEVPNEKGSLEAWKISSGEFVVGN